MAKMTVRDLIDLLEDMDDTAEVRLAVQPNYPLEHTIGDVQEVAFADSPTVVYIAERKLVGYLPTEACEALAWPR